MKFSIINVFKKKTKKRKERKKKEIKTGSHSRALKKWSLKHTQTKWSWRGILSNTSCLHFTKRLI